MKKFDMVEYAAKCLGMPYNALDHTRSQSNHPDALAGQKNANLGHPTSESNPPKKTCPTCGKEVSQYSVYCMQHEVDIMAECMPGWSLD